MNAEQLNEFALDEAAARWKRNIARAEMRADQKSMRAWVKACGAYGELEAAHLRRVRHFAALSHLDDATFTALLREHLDETPPVSAWNPCVPTVLLWACVWMTPHRRLTIAFLVEKTRDVINTPLNASNYYQGQPREIGHLTGAPVELDVTLLEFAICRGLSFETVEYLMSLGCAVTPGRGYGVAGFALTFGPVVVCRALVKSELQSGDEFPITETDLRIARMVLSRGGAYAEKGNSVEVIQQWFAEVEREIVIRTLTTAIAGPRERVRL